MNGPSNAARWALVLAGTNRSSALSLSATMKRSRVASGLFTCLVALSACAAERAQDAQPVAFAQSAGDERATRSERATAVRAPAAPRAEASEGAEVADAIALPSSTPGRADRLFELAARWEERSEGETIGDLEATARARVLALRAYGALIDEYPQYGALDEALFRAAQLHVLSNGTDQARRRFLQLIQRFPTSRFVAPSYLSFAEFFDAQQDWSSARQFYEQVASMGAADPALESYARYRVARAQFSEGDCRGASASLSALVRSSVADPAVLAAAQRDLSLLGACRAPPSALPDSVAVQRPRPRLTSSDEVVQRAGASGLAGAP